MPKQYREKFSYDVDPVLKATPIENLFYDGCDTNAATAVSAARRRENSVLGDRSIQDPHRDLGSRFRSLVRYSVEPSSAP